MNGWTLMVAPSAIYYFKDMTHTKYFWVDSFTVLNRCTGMHSNSTVPSLMDLHIRGCSLQARLTLQKDMLTQKEDILRDMTHMSCEMNVISTLNRIAHANNAHQVCLWHRSLVHFESLEFALKMYTIC